MCLILYDAVRVKYVFPFRLCRWLSLFFLRYIGIRKIVLKKKKQLVEFFCLPPAGCFSLVPAAWRGGDYCQCVDCRQASVGVFVGRVNFEAPGNSVPQELCRHRVMAGWEAGS